MRVYLFLFLSVILCGVAFAGEDGAERQISDPPSGDGHPSTRSIPSPDRMPGAQPSIPGQGSIPAPAPANRKDSDSIPGR